MITPGDLRPLMPAMLDALTAANVGVLVITDRDGELERFYMNTPAAALLGYTVEEIQRVPALATIIPAQRALIGQLTANFRAGQAIPPVLEFVAIHKDGSYLDVEYSFGFYRADDVVAYVMTLRALNQQAQLSLLEADRIGLVGALAAGFAHEINNPLTSVLLNLRSLRKQIAAMPEPAQAPAMRCVDDITTGAERIASNVRALQTLATRSATQTVDLAAVVSSALRLAAPTLEPRANVIRQILSLIHI